MAVNPAPTETGVFGMTRTIRVPSGKYDASSPSVTAAAMEITVPFGAKAASARAAEGITFGFTARITASASAASRPSSVQETP